MSKAIRNLWLFRNTPPLVLAGLGLVFGLIVFLFFNGGGLGAG